MSKNKQGRSVFAANSLTKHKFKREIKKKIKAPLVPDNSIELYFQWVGIKGDNYKEFNVNIFIEWISF